MWKKENTIVIRYFPTVGIEIDGINLEWRKERKIVQQLLGNKHTVKDSVIDLSMHFDGDTKYNIVQKRDIYKSLKNTDCLFFLNYTKEDKLRDLEIHKGCKIILGDINISFDKNMNDVIKNLLSISSRVENREPGEYYFKDLNLVVADEKKMGGNGKKISYFYCSCNTTHLENK